MPLIRAGNPNLKTGHRCQSRIATGCRRSRILTDAIWLQQNPSCSARWSAQPKVSAETQQNQQSNPLALIKRGEALADVPSPDQPEMPDEHDADGEHRRVVGRPEIKGDAALPKRDQAEALEKAMTRTSRSPNRIAVDLMPMDKSSSRSTIAYWVS